MDVAIARHVPLRADLSPAPKLVNGIVNDINNILPANLEIDISVRLARLDAEAAASRFGNLALPVPNDLRVGPLGCLVALDVLDDLTAVIDAGRRVAGLVLEGRLAAVAFARYIVAWVECVGCVLSAPGLEGALGGADGEANHAGGGYVGLEEEVERTIVVDVWGAGAVLTAVVVVRVDGAPHKVLKLDAAKLFAIELFDTRRRGELLVAADGLTGPVIAGDFAFALCGFAFCAAQVVRSAVDADATGIRRVRVEIFRKLLLGLVAAVTGVDNESVGAGVRPMIKLCQ